MKFFLPIFFILFSCQLKKDNSNNTIMSQSFYVGTYTDGESMGIYEFQLDKNGKLSGGKLVANTENPSFLAFSGDNKYLFAVNEVDEDGQGYISSFEVLRDSLKFIDKIGTSGAHPCFIASNNKNQLAVANYTGGNIALFNYDTYGKLKMLDSQQHIGNGNHPRQEAPHTHSSYFLNDNQIVAADLGSNELWFYSVENDSLNLNQKVNMIDQAGPRHLAIHPNKKWMYVLNELDNTLAIVNIEDKTTLVKETWSTLPKDFTDYSKAADIHISDDGRFLYASNRGHDSIVIFRIDENGNLIQIGFEPTRGKTPRNFSITPDGEFLIVANQDSNNLVSFKRDKKTGTLEFVSAVKSPKPVCVLF